MQKCFFLSSFKTILKPENLRISTKSNPNDNNFEIPELFYIKISFACLYNQGFWCFENLMQNI